MTKIKYLIGASALFAALTLSVWLPSTASATETDNVTICHRTNSVKNPYVRITVDSSAVDGQGNNDHSQHTGPVATSALVAQAFKNNHIKWGDIIPDAANGGVGSGLNWQDNKDGQDVFNNGCLGGTELTEVVPAAVTFTAPTCDKQGSYTVPTTENVDYMVDGKIVAAGTYSVANGTTVTVIAEAHEGYYVADETTDSWTNTFTAPTNCGQVLAATTTQVQTPSGGVGAGFGGASSVTNPIAVLGILGSLGAISYGIVRRFSIFAH